MNVIAKVAKSNGVSEKEVRKEIIFAIRCAMSNPDPQARAQWNIMFPDGKEPTPEEFIRILSGTVKAKIN